MKLIKAKTTKRFGGSPYTTLPKNASLGESQDPSPKELTPDEVASYVLSLYEKESVNVEVSNLPVLNHSTPAGSTGFYRMPYSYMQAEKVATGVGLMGFKIRHTENTDTIEFVVRPLVLVNDAFEIIVDLISITHTTS